MPKEFNTTGACMKNLHYMVNIDNRLKQIKVLVDSGKYFTINRARQYGKTTTLRALSQYLQNQYDVIFMDFQTFSSADFETENRFALSFASSFSRLFRKNSPAMSEELKTVLEELQKNVKERDTFFTLKPLFESLSDICNASKRPIVLLIDEVDSAANNQVFLDFLAQLRAQYLMRDMQATFQSVILAGVYDIKNLKLKLRPEDAHKYNSPWNIAADFDMDMSFSKQEIAGMLFEYESDYHTGMDLEKIAQRLYDYTSGYPFLVSRLCRLLDEEVYGLDGFSTKSDAWTEDGFHEAVKMILSEKNTLFESLSEKLSRYPQLNQMLQSLLFTGKEIVYNFYEPSIQVATIFGFVKNQNGVMAIANRIFETWLYNFYLSESDMQNTEMYTASLSDRNQFIRNGHLDMRFVLEKFVEHFHDLYGDQDEKFIEEEGRKYFLLYLRPIINGTGNYYIEAQTRGKKRTDVIVDYGGKQYIIEMKIWRGEEYHTQGERQLADYLDSYHQNTGYMISFNFNKNKTIGVHESVVENKRLIEAVV